MKHALKKSLRKAYARLLFWTGLHALVNRVMPRRMLVLCGHCVDTPEINGGLPADMKVTRERLAGLLSWFAARYEMCTLSEGLDALAGAERGRSLVALTMDDGYRDNAEVLPDLLDEVGARATVFLESRPLDERRVNWSHKYFWTLTRIGARQFGERFAAACDDAAVRDRMRVALGEAERLDYHVKRVLKYHAPRGLRDPLVDELFLAEGGNESELCERIYMDWDGARRMRARGIEVGGHTVRHPVLSAVSPEEALEEIREGKLALERGLGEEISSFAYPYGRRWDWNEDAARAVGEAGFRVAVTTHAGCVSSGSDPRRLARWTFDMDTELALLVAEACGGFELLRRVGLDLSE